MSDIRVHKLKTWPEPFAAIKRNEKTVELRRADRNFRVGDYLMLLEFDPRQDVLKGPHIVRKVTHIMTDTDVPRCLLSGFVAMSICEADEPVIDAIEGRGTELSRALWQVEFIPPQES